MPNFQRAARGSEAIRFIYSRSPALVTVEGLRRIYQSPGIGEITIVGSTAINLGAIAWREGTTTRIFIAGCGGRQESRTMATGYLYRRQVEQAGGFNYQVRIAGERLWADVLRELVRQNDTVELHGHSSGGAVAECLATILRRERRGIETTIDTYGAPAPGIDGACLAADRIVRQRWMNVDDPVPLVPTTVLPSGAVIYMYGVGILMGREAVPDIDPNQFRQPGGGIQISSNFYAAGTVPRFTVNPARQLQNWIDEERDPVTQHDVEVYSLVLRQLQLRFGPDTAVMPSPNVHPLPAPQPIGLVIPFNLSPRRADGDQVAVNVLPNSIALDADSRPIGTAILQGENMAFVKINPKKAFRTVKVGDSWHIALGETIVAVADPKYSARTLCRRMNAVLRALGTTNTLYLANYLDALQGWLTAATTDTDYANPTVRVDL